MPILPDRARAVAALRFRALGDETRLRLLELLGDGERSVGDLIEATALGQSLVSHHLRTLRGAGLVTTRRDGRRICYAVNWPALASTGLVLTGFEPVTTAPR